MTSNGSNDYVFAADSKFFPTAENDPVLYVTRGQTYNFVNNSGGSHPFQLRTSNGGGAYNTGVTNNGAASGTIKWTVPMTAPSSIYYQCTAHSNMGNTINVIS
jgi:plastocyanin